MRRLNLLRQLLYTATIGDILQLSPSTRHLAAVLNIENSRRRWPDVLPLPSREFLRLAGYQQSRYAKNIIARFNDEAQSSGLCSVIADKATTIYHITNLTKRNIEQALATRADKWAANLPPSLADKLANVTIEGGGGALNQGGNDRNGNDDRNHEANTGRIQSDAEQLLRELSDLGL